MRALGRWGEHSRWVVPLHRVRTKVELLKDRLALKELLELLQEEGWDATAPHMVPSLGQR